jgi:hypothetical protein
MGVATEVALILIQEVVVQVVVRVDKEVLDQETLLLDHLLLFLLKVNQVETILPTIVVVEVVQVKQAKMQGLVQLLMVEQVEMELLFQSQVLQSLVVEEAGAVLVVLQNKALVAQVAAVTVVDQVVVNKMDQTV